MVAPLTHLYSQCIYSMGDSRNTYEIPYNGWHQYIYMYTPFSSEIPKCSTPMSLELHHH